MRLMVVAGACALVLASTLHGAAAEEGMWTPQQLPDLAGPLKKAGLRLGAKQLSDPAGDPLGAVVSLGGCTAGFVSPQGLVVTNHHCAYGAIQLNSTPQNDLMVSGFSAPALDAEVPAGPNARIYVLDSIQDVTRQVRAALEAAPDALARTQALEMLESQLVARCEAEPGYRCRLYSFAGGTSYRLFRNLEIRDVRLAYAPPGGVGNFGGEADNGAWPRHTGDFTFYRAYVGRDGRPADYAPDNVPYRPKRWLKLADQPLRAGDFVMVAGYPGTTGRYALASEFDATREWTYPTIARHYRHLAGLVEAAGRKNADIATRYAAALKGWSTTLQNFEGQLAAFERLGTANVRQAEEEAVLAWLRKQGGRGAPALAAHDRLVQIGGEARATRERDLVIGQLRGTGVIGAAMQLYRLSLERELPDARREPGYQERDLPALEGAMRQMERRYHPKMDRELQAYWLREYMKLPDSQRVAPLDAWLGGTTDRALNRALDRLAKTDLDITERRVTLLSADRATIEASKDPALQLAVALTPAVLEIERAGKARAGDMLVARPAYLQAVADYRKSRGQPVYPDANASLRITYGHVAGYTRTDGSVQAPFTRLEEIVARHTGKAPYDAPKALRDAVAAKTYGGLADRTLGTVPVDFVADVDITGGNSGSPVLDARGRLVGLAFDGNRESVGNSWVFDPATMRMIAVDQRYMRWVMQEVLPARRLLEEMGVAGR